MPRAIVKRTSQAKAVAEALPVAQRAGLTAAGYSMRNSVIRELRGGYYSSLGNHGDFVTGNSINHVTVAPPEETADGMQVRVGTDLKYNLYWELGHHNIFTRHFERDPKWQPAYEKGKAQALARFVSVFKRTLVNGGGKGADGGGDAGDVEATT